MDNKYEVINVESINDNTTLYTIIDTNTNEDYSCIIEEQPKGKAKILADDLANIYDISEALFQYDLDLFPILPMDMITRDMERDYENYYPGKGDCRFYTDDEYSAAYNAEEERIKELRKTIKQLVK